MLLPHLEAGRLLYHYKNVIFLASYPYNSVNKCDLYNYFISNSIKITTLLLRTAHFLGHITFMLTIKIVYD